MKHMEFTRPKLSRNQRRMKERMNLKFPKMIKEKRDNWHLLRFGTSMAMLLYIHEVQVKTSPL